jgi:hypothetical protein
MIQTSENLTRRDFVKKSAFTAIAATILGRGTALASGSYSDGNPELVLVTVTFNVPAGVDLEGFVDPQMMVYPTWRSEGWVVREPGTRLTEWMIDTNGADHVFVPPNSWKYEGPCNIVYYRTVEPA